MSESAPAKLLYSVSDAAQALSIGVSTTWSLISSGRLSVVKIGRSTRVPASELARLASLQQPPAIGN
jgi:excisionase family DNA binding protein